MLRVGFFFARRVRTADVRVKALLVLGTVGRAQKANHAIVLGAGRVRENPGELPRGVKSAVIVVLAEVPTSHQRLNLGSESTLALTTPALELR